MKRLSFAVAALARLDDIHAYSAERFGRSRADTYMEGLADRCRGLVSGQVPSRPCCAVFGGNVQSDLRFAGARRHFVIFLDLPAEIRIVDIVHQSANIARRLTLLP